MNRWVLLCGLGCLSFGSAATAGVSSQIDSLLTNKALSKNAYGVKILRLGDSAADTKTIYEKNAETPRLPASNLKLTTTATSLEKLGPDFQFKTMLVGHNGDVALVGDGDPTFGDAELLKKSGWDVTTVFKNWADGLKQRGITSVKDVYVDDSIFDEDFLHPNWPADQVHKRYVAEVGGFNLNANCIDFYLQTTGRGNVATYKIDPQSDYGTIGNTCVTGTKDAVWLSRKPGTNEIILRGETNVNNDEPVSVTIHDPPMFAATVLKQVLKDDGIAVTGEVKRDRSIRAAVPTTQPYTNNDGWVPLAIHTTPIAAVLDRANKDSMNLYAESLCKRVGAAATGQPGSWENGTATVGAFLQSCGVKPEEFHLDDGCGLSKKNVISPNALAHVLEHEYFSPNRDVFRDSLAVAGKDGTFEKRFHESGLIGRVFGKSGYVVGVSSLSGYLHARDDHWYVFSIMMNQVSDIATAKQLQERIVAAIDSEANAAAAADK